MADVVEFRFPGGRWEKCPHDAAVAVILFSAYDLRINGEVVQANRPGAPGGEPS